MAAIENNTVRIDINQDGLPDEVTFDSPEIAQSVKNCHYSTQTSESCTAFLKEQTTTTTWHKHITAIKFNPGTRWVWGKHEMDGKRVFLPTGDETVGLRAVTLSAENVISILPNDLNWERGLDRPKKIIPPLLKGFLEHKSKVEEPLKNSLKNKDYPLFAQQIKFLAGKKGLTDLSDLEIRHLYEIAVAAYPQAEKEKQKMGNEESTSYFRRIVDSTDLSFALAYKILGVDRAEFHKRFGQVSFPAFTDSTFADKERSFEILAVATAPAVVVENFSSVPIEKMVVLRVGETYTLKISNSTDGSATTEALLSDLSSTKEGASLYGFDLGPKGIRYLTEQQVKNLLVIAPDAS